MLSSILLLLLPFSAFSATISEQQHALDVVMTEATRQVNLLLVESSPSLRPFEKRQLNYGVPYGRPPYGVQAPLYGACNSFLRSYRTACAPIIGRYCNQRYFKRSSNQSLALATENYQKMTAEMQQAWVDLWNTQNPLRVLPNDQQASLQKRGFTIPPAFSGAVAKYNPADSAAQAAAKYNIQLKNHLKDITKLTNKKNIPLNEPALNAQLKPATPENFKHNIDVLKNAKKDIKGMPANTIADDAAKAAQNGVQNATPKGFWGNFKAFFANKWVKIPTIILGVTAVAVILWELFFSPTPIPGPVSVVDGPNGIITAN